MVRKQANQKCHANEECFDKLNGMTDDGLTSFYTTFVLGCEKWKANVPTEQLNTALKRLSIQTAR